MGGSAEEAAAHYECVNGTVMDGTPCHWPGNQGAPVDIGAPLDNCVFRSNHALDPEVKLGRLRIACMVMFGSSET